MLNAIEMSGFQACIISPHRDDAAFSAGLTIAELLRNQVGVRIVNCFTISNYAPYAPVTGVREISMLRLEEDKAFLAALTRGQSVELTDLGRPDALLRLRCQMSRVRQFRPLNKADWTDITTLSRQLYDLPQGRICLAPLALGDHIDHRIACEAAILSTRGSPLGFYEDQPYAAGCTEAEIVWAVRNIAQQCGCPLLPVVLRRANAASDKYRMAAAYSSQVPPHDLEVIARHTDRYAGGERLWVTPDLHRWFLRQSLVVAFTEGQGSANPASVAAYGLYRRCAATTAGQYAQTASQFIARAVSAIRRRWRQPIQFLCTLRSTQRR